MIRQKCMKYLPGKENECKSVSSGVLNKRLLYMWKNELKLSTDEILLTRKNRWRRSRWKPWKSGDDEKGYAMKIAKVLSWCAGIAMNKLLVRLLQIFYFLQFDIIILENRFKQVRDWKRIAEAVLPKCFSRMDSRKRVLRRHQELLVFQQHFPKGVSLKCFRSRGDRLQEKGTWGSGWMRTKRGDGKFIQWSGRP